MLLERRQNKRHPCTGKIGIFLAEGEYGAQKSAILTGNLIDISMKGAGLSLPEILDGRVHLAYTAMESRELLLHIILYCPGGKEITLPAKPDWFNRSLSAHLTPFSLGVRFISPLKSEQLKRVLENIPHT